MREKTFSRGSNGCEHSRNQPSNQACSLARRRIGVHLENLPTPNTWSKHMREKTFSRGSNGCEHSRNQPSDQAKFLGGTFRALDVFHFLGERVSIQEESCWSLVGTSFHCGFLLS